MRISGGERALAILSYFPLLWIIPLKANKDSIFVQFHSRQGGVLFFLWLIVCILMGILLITPLAGLGDGVMVTVFFGVMAIASFIYLGLGLVGIFKVALGERYRMPVVADVALMLKL